MINVYLINAPAKHYFTLLKLLCKDYNIIKFVNQTKSPSNILYNSRKKTNLLF